MILLRHGQSEFNAAFNLTRRDPGIQDPKLTDLGRAQAVSAAAALAAEPIARIITSPYTRALQTAEAIAPALGVPVLVNPVVRERFAFACDVGSPRSALARDWPEHDFSGVEEVWWPAIEEPTEDVIARAALFRAEMAALPDWSDTLVVTHWGFVLALTGERLGNGEWLRCDPTLPAPRELVWRH
ncbi:MAG TPA: histidine phosphatase family protein [Acetobacteraceae bacterium]|nr:histidine phosphatase family protein [Acetobacteraceae bacterium]